jgi:hypothetical protein
VTRWRHFYVTRGDHVRNPVPRSLGRSDEDGVQYNAEMLDRAARWQWSEFLMRYHLRGTNENDYVWITEPEARAIIDTWVSEGRLPHAPGEGPSWRYFTSRRVRLGRTDPEGAPGNRQVLTREGTWVDREGRSDEAPTFVTEDDAYEIVSAWLTGPLPWRRLRNRPAEPGRDHRSAWKRSLEES